MNQWKWLKRFAGVWVIWVLLGEGLPAMADRPRPPGAPGSRSGLAPRPPGAGRPSSDRDAEERRRRRERDQRRAEEKRRSERRRRRALANRRADDQRRGSDPARGGGAPGAENPGYTLRPGCSLTTLKSDESLFTPEWIAAAEAKFSDVLSAAPYQEVPVLGVCDFSEAQKYVGQERKWLEEWRERRAEVSDLQLALQCGDFETTEIRDEYLQDLHESEFLLQRLTQLKSVRRWMNVSNSLGLYLSEVLKDLGGLELSHWGDAILLQFASEVIEVRKVRMNECVEMSLDHALELGFYEFTRWNSITHLKGWTTPEMKALEQQWISLVRAQIVYGLQRWLSDSFISRQNDFPWMNNLYRFVAVSNYSFPGWKGTAPYLRLDQGETADQLLALVPQIQQLQAKLPEARRQYLLSVGFFKRREVLRMQIAFARDVETRLQELETVLPPAVWSALRDLTLEAQRR